MRQAKSTHAQSNSRRLGVTPILFIDPSERGRLLSSSVGIDDNMRPGIGMAGDIFRVDRAVRVVPRWHKLIIRDLLFTLREPARTEEAAKEAQ